MVQQPPEEGFIPTQTTIPPPPPGMMNRGPLKQADGSPIADILVCSFSFLGFIFSLLNWYRATIDVPGYGYGEVLSGKGAMQWIVLVTYILLFLFSGFIIINHYVNIVSIELPIGSIYIIGTCLALLMTLVALAIKPELSPYTIDFPVSINWAIWIIALLLALVTFGGAIIKYMQE